jgi:Ala-tRNA(Pro) deacylase
MSINSKVTDWLDGQNAKYEVMEHDRALDTAAEARAIGIDVDQIAKALVIHITHDGNQAVIVIPGGCRISNDKVCELFGTKHARLALEEELGHDFSEFELGAVPPLSGLLRVPVYIDRRLVNHESVLFNAGTHTASIKMSMHDFINIADLSIVDVVDEREAA